MTEKLQTIDERPWPGCWLIWRQRDGQVHFLSLSATKEDAQENLDFLNREGAPCGGGWKATALWMTGSAWEAKVKALAEYRESPEQREARLEAIWDEMEERRCALAVAQAEAAEMETPEEMNA
jgi:hypothetical protein